MDRRQKRGYSGLGEHNSSLTRVHPAFDQLWQLDDGWVERLCALASRSEVVGLRQEQHWAGELLREPAYEHPAHAPIDLLRYLIDNAGDLTSVGPREPSNDEERSLSPPGEY